MVTLTHTTGPHLVVLSASSAGSSIASPLIFAIGWLAVSSVCALLYWRLVLRVAKRRLGFQRTNRGILLLALFLVAFAASNLIAADTFALHQQQFFLPIPGLFLLYFYLFSDGRYAPGWTRWLALLYGLSQIGPLVPSNKQQSNPQIAEALAHIPPGILTIGLGVIAALGDIILVTFIVIGILPQVYFRYRHLCETGARLPIQRRQGIALAGAMGAGSFVLLLASALFTQSAAQANGLVFLCVRTGFYVLATLIPVAAAFVLLRGRLYDRDALANRALIYTTFTSCLVLIYIATTGLGLFIPGLFTGPLILVFIAIDVPIMMALFPPLHAQIQNAIDRRFFRHRYDAAQALATYRLRMHEDSRLDSLSAHLTAAIQTSMQSSFVALWLRTPAALSARYGAPVPVISGKGAAKAHAEERPVEVRLRRQTGTFAPQSEVSVLTLTVGDPAREALLQPSHAIELAQLPTDSPVSHVLRDDGAMLVIPLLWQRELVGLLALGPRSEAWPYTFDDCELLTGLADQVTPALHLAHVAHEQDIELRQRERVEQELQTARRIQEALLPKTVPMLDGWQLATCYQPAREVGGDFYDFIVLADGRLGLVLGDVTDKGIPAALVMATTRSMLHAVAAQPSNSPGQVLAQVNDLLCPDLPASMFVTCFYAILDPATGALHFANAGQDLPYLRHTDGSLVELYATGMPLGLLPGSIYEEGAATLAPGDSLLFFSDGVIEAHNPQREMFGLPHLQKLLREHDDGTPPIVLVLQELANFTGPGWEQEDDITLVALQRAEADAPRSNGTAPTGATGQPEAASSVPASVATVMAGGTGDPSAGASGATGAGRTEPDGWQVLDAWTLASVPGNERPAMARLTEILATLPLSPLRQQQLQTAVSEAIMNAMEHGNAYQPDRVVAVEVGQRADLLRVRVTDQGRHPANSDIPDIPSPQLPDLAAKLAGEQSPRGWGLFLIEQLVDALEVSGDATHHTLEMRMAFDDARSAPPTDSSQD
jgi:serine phosphatase RsbU (regulator of sigma subunit)/anti-sigma regulatory factor (Ser/Thr protein kinase)